MISPHHSHPTNRVRPSDSNTVAYDFLGRQFSNTDGRGNTTRVEYNAIGQRVASIDALGNRTTYAYDQFGNLASVTNPFGHATVYEYDLRGRKTYEGGATYPVRYTYDVFGNRITMMTYRNELLGPDSGDVTTWFYDIASGSMTNKVYADGKGPKYDYTPDGKLARRIWARGIITDYAYDGWNNLTNTTYSDGTPTVSLAYDAMGRQIEAHDAAGVTTFAYDSFGSLTNETVHSDDAPVVVTNSIERFYDSVGRNAGYSLNGVRQTTLAYDPVAGRLATMLADGTDIPFIWTYFHVSDLKSSLVYPNGLTTSWTYDANNQLLQVSNATPTNVISQYDYTYDAAGRRVSCAKSGSAFAHDDIVDYGYNARSELTNAVAAVDSNYRYSYVFDDIGNRESSSERGTNSVYAANNLNQYTAITDVAAASTPSQTFNPQFDDDGNQTLIKTATGIWSVAYNGENRPILWENVSTNSPIPNSATPTLISMSFDRKGRRVTKNNQRFVYDGYLQIADNAGNMYVWDPSEDIATRPLECRLSTSQPQNHLTFFYALDGNKNVTELIGVDGNIAARYQYSAFGKTLLPVSAGGLADSLNPWRFSSEYADTDTGNISYNNRYYDFVMGRWLNRDPYDDDAALICAKMNFNEEQKQLVDKYLNIEPFQLNNFLFVGNSPILVFDMLGLLPAGKYPEWGGTDEEGVPMPPYNYVKSKGNCWRYACNDPKRNNEPRRVHPPGWNRTANSCSTMYNAVCSKKGVEKSDSSGKCKKCWYKVLLVAGDGFRDHAGNAMSDYHWYRQNDDGSWSHKPGDHYVIDGVSDPEGDAKGRGYTRTCGYFCFQEGAVDADK